MSSPEDHLLLEVAVLLLQGCGREQISFVRDFVERLKRYDACEEQERRPLSEGPEHTQGNEQEAGQQVDLTTEEVG